MNPNFSLLLFDIGNVFLFADHNITHEYLIREHGILPEKAREFYKIQEYKSFSKGEINGTQFAQAVRGVLGKKELSDEQIKYAHNIHIVRPIENAIQVLTKLHDAKRYKLAFITNTNVWQNEREGQLIDFSKYSNIIIRSNEEGLTKESSEVFTRAMDVIGKENVLFIDDNLDNIKTAKKFGFSSLHVVKNKPNLTVALQSVDVAVD